MKARLFQIVAGYLIISLVITGCAQFKPNAFPNYGPEDYPFSTQNGSVSFSIGSFSPSEVETYFASDLVKKNIWPVRAILVNKSELTYLFSKGMIEPHVTSSLVAARQGRRSVGHRLFWGYVLIISFFGIPLGVPLVASGFQAMNANSHMESAYTRLEFKDQEIKPGGTLSGILFFHQPDLPKNITVVLLDAKTDQKLSLKVDMAKLAAVPGAPETLPTIQSDAASKVELNLT